MADGAQRLRARTWLAAAVSVAIALALYLPWEHRPWDILDFSEFLPLLKGAAGFGTRLGALVHYYAVEHGRLNLIAYVALAAKWSFLGDDPMRWQWLRFVEMAGIAAAAYALARRLGAGHFGSWAGAMLFVGGHTAVEAWVRQTMGEPLGLGFVLSAALIADQRRRREVWWQAPTIALLIAGAILSKEMLIVAVPLVLAVGWARDDAGHFAFRRPGPTDYRLMAWIAGTTAPVLAAVAWAAHSASASGFSASYGITGLSPARALGIVQLGLLPAGLQTGLRTFLFPANLAWIALVVIGVAVGWREPARRPHLKMLILLAAGLPLIGALVYLPWPYFSLFYGLPWLIGPALLVAESVTVLHGDRALRPVAVAGALVLVGFTTATAGRTARAMAARQQVNGALVGMLPGYSAAQIIVVAEPEVAQQAWQGTGPTLARYGAATGLAPHLPPVVDVTCQEAVGAISKPGQRALLVSYSDRCGRLTRTSRRILATYRYLDWFRPGLVTDSLEADVLDTGAP